MSASPGMPDPGSFLVCEKMCPECLFTSARVVGEARKQDIIESCERDGTYFVCHKGSLTGNNQLCCKGFYDSVDSFTVELAKTLGVVKFIPVPSTESLTHE
jgi:hypothetical protein